MSSSSSMSSILLFVGFIVCYLLGVLGVLFLPIIDRI